MLKTSLTALTLTALPSAAFAVPVPAPMPEGSECASDGDCAEGFACEVTGGASCACEAGTDCDCAPIEFRSCVPGPCQSDADCEAGMVCATYEVPCATSAPCTPDGYCPEPPPCDSASQSICAPRWVLPCQTASDCGDGFECKPAQMCTCSGGGATDPAYPTDPADPTQPVPPGEPDGGGDSGSSDSGSSGSGDSDSAGGAPMPEDCTCEPTGDNYCVAIEVACEDDSVCPSGWTCERMNVTSVDCIKPESGGSSDPSSPDAPPPSPDDPSGEALPPAPCDAAPPAPEPTTGICYPPYAVAFDAGIPRSSESGAGTQYENGTAIPANPQDLDDNTGMPGQVDPSTGCQGGSPALPVIGLGLLMAAMWRRRGAQV